MNQGYEKIRFDDLKQCFDDKSAPLSNKEEKKKFVPNSPHFLMLLFWPYGCIKCTLTVFLKHGLAINYTKMSLFERKN